jgi:nitrile hydratase subunit alpha
MGLPPNWYKAAPYRARVVIEPRKVLAEFGVDVASDVEVRVWDSNAEIRYMVLPMRPAGTDGWSEEKLAGLVTRDAMIGTDIPKDSDERDPRFGRDAGLREDRARRE